MHFLREALVSALSSELENEDNDGTNGTKERRIGNLYVVMSSPRPSRALFPWSPNQQNASVRDIMVVYTEPLDELDSSSQLPAFALEASLYTNNSHHNHKKPQGQDKQSDQEQEEKESNEGQTAETGKIMFTPRSSFLYISKLDTTGLFPNRPSVARKLTSVFIRTLNCDYTFIFARSQSQYLFPGSAQNSGKRLMDDRKLAAWWTRTIEHVGQRHDVYWVLAGYPFDEAQQLLTGRIPPFEQEQRNSEEDKDAPKEDMDNNNTTKWIYGHPYDLLTSIADQIPSFADDPKARYMCSLCSSRIPPAGEEGDMDEHYESLCRLAPAAQMTRKEIAAQDRARERKRLDEVSVDEFWEGMGWRQECCDGHVAAFFVITSSPPAPSSDNTSTIRKKNPFEDDGTFMLPYSVYVQYWSSLHNIDYNKVQTAKESFNRWSESLESSYPVQWKSLYRRITLPPITTSKAEKHNIPHQEEQKTVAETQINVLAPRKKKKTAA